MSQDDASGTANGGAENVRSELAQSLIPVLEEVDRYPELFREECDEEAESFIDYLLENAGTTNRGNLLEEGVSLSKTNVQNVVSMLKKRLIEKYVADYDVEFTETITGDLIKELIESARTCLTDRGSKDEEYYGLDSARDSEEEVRNLIRAFPEILSTKDAKGNFPIHNLLYFATGENSLYQTNLKAISFVPLFAQQAIELKSFRASQRGGLLIKLKGYSKNVLQILVGSDGQDKSDMRTKRNKLVDECLLEVLQRLKSIGLLTRADIQKQNLLTWLCNERYFAAERFRFLSDWDPLALTKGDQDGDLPLHLTAHDLRRGFSAALGAGVDHFPDGRGLCLLFRKNKNRETPFETACELHGSEKVVEVINSALFRRENSIDADAANALILAATDKNISLDGVYFLLRNIGLARIGLSPSTTTHDSTEGDTENSVENAAPMRVLRSSKIKRLAPAVSCSNRNHKQKRQ